MLSFQIPSLDSYPSKDPTSLWALQQILLAEAVSAFGERDISKKIYQPAFSKIGPHLTHTPSEDGVFATLSDNAAGFWPTTLYEMAHETVHMLNPVVGFTNFLEEGVAVIFSEKMSEKYGDGYKMKSKGFPIYEEAKALLLQVPAPYERVAKELRVKSHSLYHVSANDITALFPKTHSDVAIKLSTLCVTR